MKAVVYEGVRQVGVQEVPDPVIEDPADAVVRMTSSAICGTDLHMPSTPSGFKPTTATIPVPSYPPRSSTTSSGSSTPPATSALPGST